MELAKCPLANHPIAPPSRSSMRTASSLSSSLVVDQTTTGISRHSPAVLIERSAPTTATKASGASCIFAVSQEDTNHRFPVRIEEAGVHPGIVGCGIILLRPMAVRPSSVVNVSKAFGGGCQVSAEFSHPALRARAQMAADPSSRDRMIIPDMTEASLEDASFREKRAVRMERKALRITSEARVWVRLRANSPLRRIPPVQRGG